METTQTPSVPVVVYTTTYCPYCSAAKRLLEDKGVAFEEVELSRDPELRATISEQTGMRTVPMVFVRGKCIGGYTELAAMDASGELDRRLTE